MSGGWIQRNKERPPERPKTVGDAIPFGVFKGTPVAEMTNERQLGYLKWMLKTEHEDLWGGAIREHYRSVGHEIKRSDDVPVIFDLEVIDRYSILFGDRWLRQVNETMEPLGIAKHLELEAFRAFDAYNRGKESAVALSSPVVDGSPDEYTIEYNGALWHIRDTWVSIKVLDVQDPEEFNEVDEEVDVMGADDIPF